MTLQKKIKESYLIKVQDDKFVDTLKKAVAEGWHPWGEPTFVLMPGSENSLAFPSYVMVYLVMVKYMESQYVRTPTHQPTHMEEIGF